MNKITKELLIKWNVCEEDLEMTKLNNNTMPALTIRTTLNLY